MKIAFYNIENLFFRHRDLLEKPKSHNLSSWRKELDTLMNTRSGRSYERIRELVFLLGFDHKDPFRYGYLNRKGMVMAMKPQHYEVSSRAGNLTDWQGWIEIENRPLPATSVRHKARIIAETNSDVLLLQEVESKVALNLFLEKHVAQYPIAPYFDLSFSQGNDDRGLDQAVLTREKFFPVSMKIYNQERNSNGDLLFQRDFVAFEIPHKSGNIWLLAAQLAETTKDKEFSEERRHKQCEALAREYRNLRNRGIERIVITGTFHAVSYCYSIAPLLRQTDLKSINRHPKFTGEKDLGRGEKYHSLGAYGTGFNLREEDYLLLSPQLYSLVNKCGIIRRGIWPANPNQWRVYHSLERKEQQASAHPLLWVDLNL